MATTLPTALVVPTRDELVAQVKRDIQLRAPVASIATGALADIDSAVITDAVLPLYGEAARQSDGRTLDGKSLDDVKQEARDAGLTDQLPAAGASGFVTITGATAGGYITAGAEIKNLLTGKRYMATVSGTYAAGAICAIVGIDTGPSSNVVANTVLTWTSPPAGISGPASVFANSDGTGLTGGRDAETATEIADRIRASRAFPAVSGNDAAYQTAALATPGLAIQAAFTLPAIVGPGSSCLVFTLRPATTGATRIPNNAQIGLVRGYVVGQMAKDDSCTFGTVTAQPTSVALSIVWANGVARWTDAVPWPPYDASVYKISAVTNALAFSITTASGSPVIPQVGQNIALYDAVNVRFVQKRILTTTGGAAPWVITIDTAANVSDTAFTPAVNDYVSPWSDSLNLLPPLVASYFDGLGPGEQVSTFFDAGYRQRRSPADPQFWPMSLTTKVLIPILKLDAVSNANVSSPTLPLTPTVGTPGVNSNMLTLAVLGVYAG